MSEADIAAGLDLTGHFLDVRVMRARGVEMPDARGRLRGYVRGKLSA